MFAWKTIMGVPDPMSAHSYTAEPDGRSRLSRAFGRIGGQLRFVRHLLAIAFLGHAADRGYDEDVFPETPDPFVDVTAQWPNANKPVAGIRSFLPAAVAASDNAWGPSAADYVYTAFDASQPVQDPQDLLGRDQHIAHLMRGVLFRRTHGIVSGPRGSGKTSLVRVFAQYAETEGVVVFYAACDRGTLFADLMRDFLEQIPGYAVDPDNVELFAERVAHFGRENTPQQAASILGLIKYSQIVFVVDECDRPENPEFRTKMASLLKLISDARVPVRLVLVSSSSIFDHIVGEHQSLMRHVTRLTTEPLERRAIHELLDSCAGRCEMRFTPEAKKLLCQIVCGSPYHARLFGMHSALAAVARKHSEIERHDVLEGLSESFDEWAMLNREDASSFVSLMAGGKGDPRLVVEAARRFASPGEPEAIAANSHGGPGADEQQLLKALAPAVERANGGIAFRDATAPQFLIALQHISTGSKRARHAKGGASV